MLMQVNKNPSPKELKQFGITLMIGFGLLGGLLFWRGKLHTAYGLWGVGVPLGLLAFLIPSAAKGIYRLWMGWAFVMGTIVTRVILTALFFIILTPVALLFRLKGRDALRLKKEPERDTYWNDHPKITERSSYDRLF